MVRLSFECVLMPVLGRLDAGEALTPVAIWEEASRRSAGEALSTQRLPALHNLVTGAGLEPATFGL
jgi:hypothetical protein